MAAVALRWLGRVTALLCGATVLSALSSLASALATASPPLATASPSRSCNLINYEPYYDGGQTVFTTVVFGTESYISSQEASLCGAEGLSLAWPMVVGNSSDYPGHVGWAQVGYGHFGSGTTNPPFYGYGGFWLWDEWVQAYGKTRLHTIVYGNSVPQNALYSVVWSSNCDCLQLRVGSLGELDYTSFDPGSKWNAAWQGQWYGETNYPSDDVPGTQDDPANFTGVNIETWDGSWASPQSFRLESPDLSQYKQALLANPPNFKIWTYPP
ncbi:MAG TPA: hypothetical protein VFI30_08830 [Nocardioidaceae bacterium]|nr:hypothetical protein [Nocardioidaceae bacterium]